MQIKGQVIHKSEITTVWQKQLEKQFIVIKEVEHEEDYKNNALAIDFLWDKIDMLKEVEKWDIITVDYNTSVNEYKDKFYNSVRAWKVEVSKPDTSEGKFWESEEDDLPF